MALTLRKQRLRLTWLLAVPFVLLARPTPGSLLVGIALALPGLVFRALAAARIHKDRVLATRGPYAHLRHPLYLGSFLVGLGLVVAGGRWLFPPLFVVGFLWLYRRTIEAEERALEERFGEAWRVYRDTVPFLLPRLRGWRNGPLPAETREPALRPGLALYLRNREWEAALGTGAGFALLWVLMIFRG